MTDEWKKHISDRVSDLTQKIQHNPFTHSTTSGFLPNELLANVSNEFPDYNWEHWFVYSNKIEDKKALNDWNKFPKYTYALFAFLNSPEFISQLEGISGCRLFPDPGLHGGGWHIHASGGILNPHLDYSIHPKLGMQRKLNLIIYLCQDWEESWGGHFGLWELDKTTGKAGNLIKEYPVTMNRAMVFDTTQNSWHGLSRTVACPPGNARRSLAIYYMAVPPENVDTRGRALYSPTKDQIGDNSIEELIRQRAGLETSASVYKQ
jgi:Rps23 Pro-64 3,4-dihydroxylase Tpa1-like proline 4-hydroxylase